MRSDSCGAARPARRWKPFPVSALPEPVRTFVLQAAAAIGCDPALVALPALSTMAAAIGSSQVIELKPGWIEPSVLWTAAVSDSGTLKSPAQALAVAPLLRRQAKILARSAPDLLSNPASGMSFKSPESAIAMLRATYGDRAALERLVVDDITIPSLAVRLSNSPYGLLLAADELSPLVRSMSKGANAGYWTKVYGAGPITIDRKTRDEQIFAPHAAVSVTGGIQPGTLREFLVRRLFEIGIVARLLLAHPPRSRRRWTDATVDPAVLQAYDMCIERLLSLRPRHPSGRTERLVLRLGDDAMAKWVAFFDRHGERQFSAAGDEAAMLSKIEGTAARLALVTHSARAVGDDADTIPVRVDAESMQAGIDLAEWFADENERIYDELRMTPGERERDELIAWIERRGGRVRVRDVQQGLRRLRGDAEAARAALNDLVSSGLGRWVEIPAGSRGGRPTWEFVLATATDPPPSGS